MDGKYLWVRINHKNLLGNSTCNLLEKLPNLWQVFFSCLIQTLPSLVALSLTSLAPLKCSICLPKNSPSSLEGSTGWLSGDFSTESLVALLSVGITQQVVPCIHHYHYFSKCAGTVLDKWIRLRALSPIKETDRLIKIHF